jgi:osmotically-inducible protein OsmY
MYIRPRKDITMQNKLRQLITSALKRNIRTTTLTIEVSVRGYNVVVSGSVPSQEIADEVVGTIESVSPHLRVKHRMTIVEAEHVIAR